MVKQYMVERWNKYRIEAFWNRVERRGENECWNWTGYKRCGPKNPEPYGMLGWKGRSSSAHRVSFDLTNGEIPEGYLVDHEDTDRLNNRIGNLRLALPTNSMSNTNLRSDNTSGVKGVSWDKQRGLWIARVYANRKKYYAGHHSSIEAASIAIETMRNSVHGEFANHGKVFIISN